MKDDELIVSEPLSSFLKLYGLERTSFTISAFRPQKTRTILPRPEPPFRYIALWGPMPAYSGGYFNHEITFCFDLPQNSDLKIVRVYNGERRAFEISFRSGLFFSHQLEERFRKFKTVHPG